MALAPAMFAGNMLVARATAGFIPPVALAFWRWALVFGLLLPFVWRELWDRQATVGRELPDLLLLGALGMGVCGALVYVAAATTTATNIGLIYSVSPILIILIDRFFYGQSLSGLQMVGIAGALAGVLTIILKGDPRTLLHLGFVAGDLWILVTAFAWALYSVRLRHRPSALSLPARLAAMAACGALAMLPFLLWEAAAGQVPSLDAPTVAGIVFVALVPGIGAYQSHGSITRVLGASLTGLLLYLTPVYNTGLAWLLLGETLHTYHLVGAVLVLSGLALSARATRPA